MEMHREFSLLGEGGEAGKDLKGIYVLRMKQVDYSANEKPTTWRHRLARDFGATSLLSPMC